MSLVSADGGRPVLRVAGALAAALEPAALAGLDGAALARFLGGRRWFGAKGRTPRLVKVHDVVPVDAPPVRAAVARLEVDLDDGRLLDAAGAPVRPRYVLTDESVDLAGIPVRRDAPKQVVLHRLRGPMRTRSHISGIYEDTWSGPELIYRRFRCPGGRLVVALESDPRLFRRRQTITAHVGGRVAARKTIDPDFRGTMVVPLRALDRRCAVRFQIRPTAVPARVLGSDDTRRLGVHFRAFRFEARRAGR